MQGFIQDCRFALRMMRRRPVASAVIVLTLGLGIGANATFFNGFYGMVLRPLPFAEPERLVALHESQPALGKSWYGVSSPNLHDWTEGQEALAAAGAFDNASFNLQVPGNEGGHSPSDGEPERVLGAAVTASLFPMLGVRPALGRHFRPEEDAPGGPRAVIIGHDLWTRRLAADPRAIGRTLRVDDEVHEIVGVMPEGFRFHLNGQMWTPLRLDAAGDRRDDRRLEVIARLAEGVSLDEAQVALAATAGRLEELHPDTNAGWSVQVRRLHDALLPPVTQLAAAAQQALACFVLLIVCANVASIILAQATVRQQETALRAALGAGRGRLVRQAITESTVLALFGGALGVLLAAWGEAWMKSLSTITIPYWLSFDMNSSIVIYTVAVTLLTGFAVGLLPALRSSGFSLFEALKTGGHVEGESGGRLRKALVVAEYALALVILVGALLMVRSYLNLQEKDPGFESRQVLTLRLSLTGRAYDDPEARSAFLDEVLRRLNGLAEVASAGAVDHVPISREGYVSTALGAEGQVYPQGEEPGTTWQTISRDYLETLGIPLRRGRLFTAGEVREGGGVVVVSESLAARLWPGQDPLGRRIRTLRGGAGPWLEVVGVVGDVEPPQPLAGIDTRPASQIYVPLAHAAPGAPGPPRLPTLVLRSRAEPATLAAAVRREVRRADPGVPLFQVLTMERVIRRYYFAQHLWSRMFSAIAVLALAIAAIGAYGATAYSVSRRTREMGIRVAMGAKPFQLLALVLGQGLWLALGGVLVGLALAIPLARLMASLIHDLSAHDPGVFTLVVATLAALALVATYLPARRAATVDPITALRNE